MPKGRARLWTADHGRGSRRREETKPLGVHDSLVAYRTSARHRTQQAAGLLTRTKRCAPNCMAKDTAYALAATHSRLHLKSIITRPVTSSHTKETASAAVAHSKASCATEQESQVLACVCWARCNAHRAQSGS